MKTQPGRRHRILAAALQEFSEHGYSGARTARIAQRAAANKQLIHYYFGSKRGLYEAVLHEAKGRLTPDTEGARALTDEPARHPAERIRAKLRSVYESFTHKPELRGLLVSSLGTPGGDEALRPAVQALVADLTAAISDGQGLGYFRDDVEPETAAQQAVVLAVGYLVLEQGMLHGPAPERRAGWLEDAATLLVGSLTW